MKRTNYQLVRTLQKKGMNLAIAESMTCGLMAHQLCNVKGTSEVLIGSLVCYQPEVKIEVCKVPASLLERYTAESQEVTDALAKNLPQLFKASIYLAVTGLAAPGGSETPNKPVGSVFLSVYLQGTLHRLNLVLKGTPLQIRKQTCVEAYEFLLKVLRKAK